MDKLGLKKGIMINFISKYSNILLQLIINSILARLLTPNEYGVIAIAMIFIAFFNLFGDMGIGPAIIQHKELEDDDISSIFIFTLGIAVFLSILFFMFSYFIAYLYKNDVYISIGHLLCISIIFNVLCSVPNGVHLKNKQFKIVGISTLVSNLIAGIVTIILAYLGFSYYALVISSIMQSMLNFFVLFYLSRIKIKFNKFSLNTIKKISSFSMYQFLFNFINYFSRNSDNILIGKFLGMNALGYYDKAYKLMLYPVQNLTFIITPVLQPVLSDYQHREDIILNTYKKIVKILALLGAFISVFCYFSANEIILIMFGKQWVASVVSFKILSISIIIQMILSSSGAIFQATNNVKLLFVSGLSGSIIMVTAIIIGLLFAKIEIVAFAITIGYCINFIQCFYFLIVKVFQKSFFEFIKEFKSTIIVIVFTIIPYIVIPFNINNVLLSAIVKGGIGFIFYIIGMIVTKEYYFIYSVIFGEKRVINKNKV